MRIDCLAANSLLARMVYVILLAYFVLKVVEAGIKLDARQIGTSVKVILF